MVLGHMAGEISPDMMFWAGRQKMSNMGADAQRLVCITRDNSWSTSYLRKLHAYLRNLHAYLRILRAYLRKFRTNASRKNASRNLRK